MVTVTFPPQLSVAVALPNTTPVAVQEPSLLEVVDTGAGHVITGLVVSDTVTVNEQVETTELFTVAV